MGVSSQVGPIIVKPVGNKTLEGSYPGDHRDIESADFSTDSFKMRLASGRDGNEGRVMSPKEAIERLSIGGNRATKIERSDSPRESTRFGLRKDREAIALAIFCPDYLEQVQQYEASQQG